MDLATIDHLLTTTRSVRKRLDFDRAVEPELIERCIELALQAPTGSNLQGWHFMVVTDPEQRAEIAKLYRKGQQAYYRLMQDNPARFSQTDSRLLRRNKLVESSAYLSSNLQRVPVFDHPLHRKGYGRSPPLGRGGGTKVRPPGIAIRIHHSGGVVADAGLTFPRFGFFLHDLSPVLRKRGGGVAGDPRTCATDLLVACRILQGEGFSTGQPAPGP